MAITEELFESFFDHESGDTVQITPVEITGEDESIDPDTHTNIDYGITPPETDVDFEEVKPDPTECETKPKGLTEEEKKNLEKERIIRKKQSERIRRKAPLYIKDYILKEDEVAIVGNTGEKLYMIHSPVDIEIGSHIGLNNYLESSLKFDKNLNVLSSSILYKNNKSRHNIPCLNQCNFRKIDTYHIAGFDKFIIVNKKKLFESKGTVYSIKGIYGYSHREALYRVKQLKSVFTTVHQHIANLREIVAEIYDEETFEIIVDTKVYNSRVDWNIDILFPEVTLRNSRNMSYYLGTMAVRIGGTLNISTGNFNLNYTIDGHRVSWTIRDIQRGFRHSHLTQDMKNVYTQFCIGEGHIFDTVKTGSNPTKEELQSLLLMLDTFVKWESLEGGPYYTFSQSNSRRNRDIILPDNFNALSSISSNRSYNIMKQLVPFNNISHSFKLIRERDELRYIIDEKEFLETMVNELGMIESNIINLQHSYFFYNKNKNIFIYNSGNHNITTPSNITQSHFDNVKNHCENFPETYINGKLIKAFHDPKDPWVNKDKKVNKEEELVRTLNPDDMLYVAYNYLYELNKNLKDVKKQELEQQ